MTDDRNADTDDAARLAELARGLAAIDLDGERAAQILRRARHGPSALRLVEPVAAAIVALGYLAWAIAKVFEALGG